MSTTQQRRRTTTDRNDQPVTESTIAAGYLQGFLTARYALEERTRCKLFRTGMNHLYVNEDGNERYVFRIYNFGWRTREEISEEVRLLNYLHINREKAEYFMTAYERVTPLEVNEKQFIPCAALSIMLYYFGVQCDKFDTWSNIFLTEDHLRDTLVYSNDGSHFIIYLFRELPNTARRF